MKRETSHKIISTTRLRDLRHQQQWTQAMMAEALGVTELTIRRWEKGQTRPSLYYVNKICVLFEKTPEDLGSLDSSASIKVPMYSGQVEEMTGEVESATFPVLKETIADESKIVETFSPTALPNTKKVTGTLSENQRETEDAGRVLSPKRGRQPDSRPLLLRRSRLVWWIISIVCLVLVLSGSLVWIWGSTSSHGTAQKVHTSRLSHYVCGDQAILTDIKNWTTVQANSSINTPDYSGPANGYTGPDGNPASNSKNCSGSYHWAWNQSSVQAMWIWSNAYLPNGKCNVDVHIPSWYAGAPDAHYALTIKSSTSSVSYTFDTQDQNQPATMWIALHIQHQVPSIPMPNSTDNTYTFTLTLTNGETHNWYLGADAIRFNCFASL